jgi:hypothetical protein
VENALEQPITCPVSAQPGAPVPVIGADPLGALEVGEHQDVEQLGAGSGTEGVEALLAAGSV